MTSLGRDSIARGTRPPAGVTGDLGVGSAAALPVAEVLSRMGVDADLGLSDGDAELRLGQYGPNAVTSHRARFFPVLWHQLRSPLLGLLLGAAVASYFVGERSDAVIIGVIVAV